MKGVYRLRPPLPKYNATWDVGIVLRHLNSLSDSNLKELSGKCAMLLVLTSGQRVQTINSLDLRFLTTSPGKMVFAIRDVLKTSKPGSSLSLEIAKYPQPNTNICPYDCLSKYLELTKSIRSSNRLFISCIKPHKPVSTKTISRWLTRILNEAGVETGYGSHSIRHASTSRAASMNVPIDVILNMAGWNSERTFERFYRRKVLPDKRRFANAVLDAAHIS
jgi:integrase